MAKEKDDIELILHARNGDLKKFKESFGKRSTTDLGKMDAYGRTVFHNAGIYFQVDLLKELCQIHIKGLEDLDDNSHSAFSLTFQRFFSGSVGGMTKIGGEEEPTIQYLRGKYRDLMFVNKMLAEQLQHSNNGLKEEAAIMHTLITTPALRNHMISGFEIKGEYKGFKYHYKFINKFFEEYLGIVQIEDEIQNNRILICFDRSNSFQKKEALARSIPRELFLEASSFIAQPKAANSFISGGKQILKKVFFGDNQNIIYSFGAAAKFARLLELKLSNYPTKMAYFSSKKIENHVESNNNHKSGADKVYNKIVSRFKLEKQKENVICLHKEDKETYEYIKEIDEYISVEDKKLNEEMLDQKNIKVKVESVLKTFQNSLIHIIRDPLYEKLLGFSQHEYIAHSLAYMHLPSETPVFLFKSSKVEDNIQYVSYRIIHNDGLYCYALLPKNHQSSSSPIKVILAFQGTDPLDNTSLARDANTRSAGFQRIFQQYLTIVFRLHALLKSKNINSYEFVIVGHSLGGADAQNMVAALLTLKAQSVYLSSNETTRTLNPHLVKFIDRRKPEYTSIFINKLRGITLYAYNTAGVRFSTAELARFSASFIHQKDPTFKVFINHLRVSNDPVNFVNQTILHDFEISSAVVNLLLFTGESFSSAHTNCQFQNLNKALTHYYLYQNYDVNSDKILKEKISSFLKLEIESEFLNNIRGIALQNKSNMKFQNGVFNNTVEDTSVESVFASDSHLDLNLSLDCLFAWQLQTEEYRNNNSNTKEKEDTFYFSNSDGSQIFFSLKPTKADGDCFFHAIDKIQTFNREILVKKLMASSENKDVLEAFALEIRQFLYLGCTGGHPNAAENSACQQLLNNGKFSKLVEELIKTEELTCDLQIKIRNELGQVNTYGKKPEELLDMLHKKGSNLASEFLQLLKNISNIERTTFSYCIRKDIFENYVTLYLNQARGFIPFSRDFSDNKTKNCVQSNRDSLTTILEDFFPSSPKKEIPSVIISYIQGDNEPFNQKCQSSFVRHPKTTVDIINVLFNMNVQVYMLKNANSSELIAITEQRTGESTPIYHDGKGHFSTLIFHANENRSFLKISSS